ncbi:MAG: HlyD family efflux transporter periplasmic adaptor subunit [Fuerstiella sp.]
MKYSTASTFFFRWMAPLLVLAAAGLFIFAMGRQQKPNRKKAAPRLSIPVEIVNAAVHTGPLDIEANGVAIPFREVKLTAQVGGEVVFKANSLSPGQYVTKNETLLKIDPESYQLEVARLEQEYAKAEQDLVNIQVKTENTQRLLQLNREMVGLRQKDVQRLDRLRSTNATSAAESDAMRMAWLTTTEHLTMEENQLREFASQTKTLQMTRELVSLQLRRAKLDMKRTTITAPFSGVVIANHVEQNGSVLPGTAIATIEDTSKVEVRCSLRSDDLEFILQNGPSTPTTQRHQTIETSISADHPVTDAKADASAPYRLPPTAVTIECERGGRQYQWTGVLSRPDGLGIDTRTRTMPVRILVPNPTGRPDPTTMAERSPADPPTTALLRGMFVKVKLHCEPQASFLSIPESVVRPGKTVWIMRDGKLQIQPIRIVRIEEGRAYFDSRQSTLTATDSIISSPVPNARAGLSVSLMKNKQKKKQPNSTGSQMRDGAETTGTTNPSPPRAKQQSLQHPSQQSSQHPSQKKAEQR